MNTEKFVPPEIAVSLKEKGFNDPCLACYRNTDLYFERMLSGYASDIELSKNSDFDRYSVNTERPHYWKSAPTHQEAIDWVWKEHQILITPVMLNSYQVSYEVQTGLSTESFMSKDEAIKHALTLIK